MKIAAIVLRLAVLISLWLSAPDDGAAAAQGGGAIQGLVYVSYSGDLSVDVMFAKSVELLLISAETGIEKEVERLKTERLAPIRAQEAVAIKAHAEARRAVGYEQTKQKREALKRESDKFEKLKADYEKSMVALLAERAVQKTKTDGEGKFRFQGLAPGRYLLHARFSVKGVDSGEYFWLHAVDLKAGQESEVQLSKTTVFSLY